jgi:hypothetical protein
MLHKQGVDVNKKSLYRLAHFLPNSEGLGTGVASIPYLTPLKTPGVALSGDCPLSPIAQQTNDSHGEIGPSQSNGQSLSERWNGDCA